MQTSSQMTMPSEHTKVGNAVDAVLDRAVENKSIVGGVVLVSLRGKRIHERAIGYADREGRIPARLDTIFRWASLTKPVVAVTTAALIERGVIDLDGPVTRHLPDFRPQLPNGEMPVITVRHLITHTAGLTYGLFEHGEGPYHQARISDGLDQPGLSIEVNLRRIASVPLSRTPGSGWGYSLGTDVLGAVIQRATDTPLPEVVHELVTRPLGMKDSGFGAADRTRLAVAYADGSPAPQRMGSRHFVPFDGGKISFAPDRLFDSSSYASGGAGMSGTASDFLLLLESLRMGGAPILKPSSIDLLATIKPTDYEVAFRPGWKWPLGWAVLEDPSKTKTPQSPGTWSWGGVYGSSWFVDRSRDLSMVLLTNTAVAGMLGQLPDSLRNAIYDSI